MNFKISQNHKHSHSLPQTPVAVVNPACSWSELLGNQLWTISRSQSSLFEGNLFLKFPSSRTWGCLPSYSCSCLPRTGKHFSQCWGWLFKVAEVTVSDGEERGLPRLGPGENVIPRSVARHGRVSSPKWPSASVDPLHLPAFSQNSAVEKDPAVPWVLSHGIGFLRCPEAGKRCW